MRTLIIGGSGMLGYQLLMTFQNAGLSVAATLRNKKNAYKSSSIDFQNYHFFDAIDAYDLAKLEKLIEHYQPNCIINATRYKPNEGEAHSYIDDIEITSLFPLRLGLLCEKYEVHLIHISTNCVFSGNKPSLYLEEDTSDAIDLYGRCKSIAENIDPNFLVLRTSIIGLEPFRPRNLINWFLTQKKETSGFTKAYFNGLTVPELSRQILKFAQENQPVGGIWHLATKEVLSKFDIISRLANKLQLNTRIIPNEQKKHFALLDPTKFEKAFNYTPPSWDIMLNELADNILEKTAERVP